MTNFDFLLEEQAFAAFADVAVSAEKILHIDPAACVLNCRRAMEFAIKWMYSVDKELDIPCPDSLVALLSTREFKSIVGHDLWQRLDLIRRMGNNAAHTERRLTQAQAALCLENLFVFLDFVSYCYAETYTPRKFDPKLWQQQSETLPDNAVEVNFQQLLAENAALKAQLTARRTEHQIAYVPKPLVLSEYKTRQLYIDTLLQDAGWTEGEDWRNGVLLPGGKEKADYVLYGSDRKPLALVEASATSEDVSKGRQQARLFADLLEKRHGRRPVIFLTNGFDTRMDDSISPERAVSGIYSRQDLEQHFSLQKQRKDLKRPSIDRNLADRAYQRQAVEAACDAFDRLRRRKALLVMAPGTGKTRTVAALFDVLRRHGWAKKLLFLSDQQTLVTQAERSFQQLLPDLSTANLCQDAPKRDAACIFATYEAIMDGIDSVRVGDSRQFTCGCFDLLVCDEAHGAVFQKYRDVFSYFDAPLVGLTATPSEEIDESTYRRFDLEPGAPTFDYPLDQAVRDGFLVDFTAVEQAEDLTFDPEACTEDALRAGLRLLMEKGLRIKNDKTMGKTILFTQEHRQSEQIFDLFNREYPQFDRYAMVIDSQIERVQSAIDRFSDPKALPRIAISCDLLDSGIDVPEVLNLAFFRQVPSKARFWQMLGRGMRLCPKLLDGKDKNTFHVFDFCGNFEFFRMNTDRYADRLPPAGAVLALRAELVWQLQGVEFQTEALMALRDRLLTELLDAMRGLHRERFAVRQHLRTVEQFSERERYEALTKADVQVLRDEAAPLFTDCEAIDAARFDALTHRLQLSQLTGEPCDRAKEALRTLVEAMANLGTIPEIRAQGALIGQALRENFEMQWNVSELERLRTSLRSAARFVGKEGRRT